MTMRLFTAIQLSDNARAHLLKMRADVASMFPADRIKWVEPGNLHVTLKFLGEVPDDHVPDLRAALATVRVDPMRLRVDRFDGFPAHGPMRVLVARLGGDVEAVGGLFDHVERACESCGFARDQRPYTPHVTLGRSKHGVRRHPAPRQWAPGPEFLAAGFDLIHSALGARGSTYRVIQSFSDFSLANQTKTEYTVRTNTEQGRW
jgi:2'-5' RNA ligase